MDNVSFWLQKGHFAEIMFVPCLYVVICLYIRPRVGHQEFAIFFANGTYSPNAPQMIAILFSVIIELIKIENQSGW